MCLEKGNTSKTGTGPSVRVVVVVVDSKKSKFKLVSLDEYST